MWTTFTVALNMMHGGHQWISKASELFLLASLLLEYICTYPSFIYSWSISHILEYVQILLFGPFGQQEMDLSFSEQLLRVVFFNFLWAKFFFLNFFENIVASALISCIKWFFISFWYLEKKIWISNRLTLKF